jgi:hypothetical protein
MKINLYTHYEIVDDGLVTSEYVAITNKECRQDELLAILELHNEKVGPIERKLLTK